MTTTQVSGRYPTLFGHPCGLFTLFFAEMWERFSYYGMRALLLFYMIKGFLGYGDNDAYAVYGAYTALVYMTPFFGGMLADRLLGARRAVVLGGLLMAGGHLMMTVEDKFAFFTALALLILGNGFFKPNISTIVGSLYRAGSPKRDGGFTIFYMGINLGAAMSPLLCGYVGETYGWHYGFGLATIGMLTGLAVFVAPSVSSQLLLAVLAGLAAIKVVVPPDRLRYWLAGSSTSLALLLLCLLAVGGVVCFVQLRRGRLRWSAVSQTAAAAVILAGVIAAAWGLWQYHPENFFSMGVNVFVALSLLTAAAVACLALSRGGLPAAAGGPPDEQLLRQPLFGLVSVETAVCLATVAAVPLFALLVSGFSLVTPDGHMISLISESLIERWAASGSRVLAVLAVAAHEMSKPAGLVLMLSGLAAFVYLGFETFRLHKVPRERMFVVLILTFFSMLFWSFFEQAGSSVNNFTDRNVDRVFEQRHVTSEEVGKTIRIQPTQEQLGYHNGDKLFTIDQLDRLREQHERDPDFEIEWTVAPDNVGMGIAKRIHEIPASTFQSVNPIYILIFGLVFTALWTVLGQFGLEPSTPVKFSLGLLQLGLGFGAFWFGAQMADERGMVLLGWLFLGYLLQTTGELCLSPVGLSMVTKLSPAHLVSTVMGTWFLATAFSQLLAAIIAQFTGVTEGGADSVIPIPRETVHVYGDVFGIIAGTAIASALICFILSPLLSYWMHSEVVGEERPVEE